jgi:hypothetical protein
MLHRLQIATKSYSIITQVNRQTRFFFLGGGLKTVNDKDILSQIPMDELPSFFISTNLALIRALPTLLSQAHDNKINVLEALRILFKDYSRHLLEFIHPSIGSGSVKNSQKSFDDVFRNSDMMNLLVEFLNLETAHKHLLLSKRNHEFFVKRMWNYLTVSINQANSVLDQFFDIMVEKKDLRKELTLFSSCSKFTSATI